MQESLLIQTDLESFLKNHRVVLFMKGCSNFPVCGLSCTACYVLKKCNLKFSSVDLLVNPGLHLFLREKHVPIAAPYLYIAGEFVGGYEKIISLYHSGQLQDYSRSIL